jgi:hypothetical protein
MSRATLDTYSSSNRGLDRFLASAGRPPRSRIVRSAASVFEMVQSILQDRKRVLSCAVYLHGEYKTRDLFAGVPCRPGVGRDGAGDRDRVLAGGADAVNKSAAAVKELRRQAGGLGLRAGGVGKGSAFRPPCRRRSSGAGCGPSEAVRFENVRRREDCRRRCGSSESEDGIGRRNRTIEGEWRDLRGRMESKLLDGRIGGQVRDRPAVRRADLMCDASSI